MAICCDVCFLILGKGINYKELVDSGNLRFIGRWEICITCLDRYDDIVFDDVKSKEFRKN